MSTEDCYGQTREFAGFYHSTPARLLLHAFYRLGRLGQSVEAHTQACMRDYLETLPGNAVELIFALYRNGQEEMERKLLTPVLARRLLETLPSDRWDGLADAGRLLYALWRIENSPTEDGSARDLCAVLKARCQSGLPAFGESLGLSQAWWFLYSVSKLDPDYHRKLLMGLDYPALGRCSRGEGTATVVTFLNAASRAGVDKAELHAFCAGLDFAGLGRRSCGVGLSTVKGFLNAASRAGVDKANLLDFCEGLDFAELGRRSCDVGLATVANFLNTASRAGVDKGELLAFCEGLDFVHLGAGIVNVSLSKVWPFMQTVSLIGVSDEKLLAFADQLDWRGLGEKMRPKPDGQRKVSLAELIWVAKNRGIGRTHARAFVEGWGWTDIRIAVENHLSPDGLAALLDLLLFRCGYSDSELTTKGIKPSDDKLWLRAFANHVGGEWEHSKNQARYFAFALRRLEAALRRHGDSLQFLNLRQWNILARNLSLANPATLDTILWSAICRVTRRDWTRLMEQADLTNLSIFLSRFGPDNCFHGRTLPIVLPKPEVLAAKLKSATVLEAAHLMVNLWWANAGDTAAGLVRLWQEDAQWLPADFDQANLRPLIYLAWGALLAIPPGDWLEEGAFAQEWRCHLDALKQEKSGEVEDWLGAIGIYALAGKAIPWDAGSWWFSIKEAEQRLMGTFASLDSELIRRLAGLLALFPDQITPSFRKDAIAALQSLPVRNQIPMYEQARTAVVSSFTDGVSP